MRALRCDRCKSVSPLDDDFTQWVAVSKPIWVRDRWVKEKVDLCDQCATALLGWFNAVKDN